MSTNNCSNFSIYFSAFIYFSNPLIFHVNSFEAPPGKQRDSIFWNLPQVRNSCKVAWFLLQKFRPDYDRGKVGWRLPLAISASAKCWENLATAAQFVLWAVLKGYITSSTRKSNPWFVKVALILFWQEFAYHFR